MQIERIFYPVEVLGPGKRIGIWTVGCSKGCPGCVSRELWKPCPVKDMPLTQITGFVLGILNEKDVDGITISGGDPLEQRTELLQLISAIYPKCDDILLYTGYTLGELCESWNKNDLNLLKSHIAVLIDGRYVDALNDNSSPLIGSTNQVIHFFDERKHEIYDKYCCGTGRCVQNIYSGDNLISIGIHSKK